jgi:hypothetical protein
MERAGDVLALIEGNPQSNKTISMNFGIKIEIDWFDNDAISLRVRCSNGGFSGETYLYVTHSDFVDMGKRLKGFPKSPSDIRDIELGTFEPTWAGGGIKLHFYCVDRAGHAKVDVKLRSDRCKALGDLDSAAFSIPVESAAIDSFISQIMKMTVVIGGSVELFMAT